MSETFTKAVAAVLERHRQYWSALSQSERSVLIYAEMRKMDAETGQASITALERNPTGNAQNARETLPACLGEV